MYFLHTYYGFIPIISIISAVAFLAVIFNFLFFGKKLKIKDVICIPVFLFGVYMIIPFSLVCRGISNKNPDLLNKALKLSISPLEKNEVYYQLGRAYDTFRGKFDGNLAIKYYELAIKGKYEKNKKVSELLLKLYFYKGDYNKVAEITSRTNTKNKIWLTFSYIMQKKYRKALEVCPTLNVRDEFIIADLYRLTDQNELAQKHYKIALEKYHKTYPKKTDLSKDRAFLSSIGSMVEEIHKNKIMYKFK